MLKLRLLTGPRAGRQLRVSDTKPVSVGRRKGRLRLHDSRVSKQHAEIAFEEGVWVLRDLGSANGTYVNREKVVGLAELEPGDLVQMGRVLIKVTRCDGIGMDTEPELQDDLLGDELLGVGAAVLDAGQDDDLDLDALFEDEQEEPGDPSEALEEVQATTESLVDEAEGDDVFEVDVEEPDLVEAAFEEPVDDDDSFFADIGEATDTTDGAAIDVAAELEGKEQSQEDDPFLSGSEHEDAADESEDNSDQISLEDESGMGPRSAGTTLLTTVDHDDLVIGDEDEGETDQVEAMAEDDQPSSVADLDDVVEEQEEDEAPAVVGLHLDHAPPQQPESEVELEEAPEADSEPEWGSDLEIDSEVASEPEIEPRVDAEVDDDSEPAVEPELETFEQFDEAPELEVSPAAELESVDQDGEELQEQAEVDAADLDDMLASAVEVEPPLDLEPELEDEAGLDSEAEFELESAVEGEVKAAIDVEVEPSEQVAIDPEPEVEPELESPSPEPEEAVAEASAPLADHSDNERPVEEQVEELEGPEFDIDAAFDALSEGLDDSVELPAIGGDLQDPSEASAGDIPAEQGVDQPTGPSDVPESLIGSQLDVGFIQDALSQLEENEAADASDKEPPAAGDGVTKASASPTLPPSMPPTAPGLSPPPPGLNPESVNPPVDPRRTYPPHDAGSSRGRWFLTLLLFLCVGGAGGFLISQNYESLMAIAGRESDAPAGPTRSDAAIPGTEASSNAPKQAGPVAQNPPTPQPPVIPIDEGPAQAEPDKPVTNNPDPFAAGPGVLGPDALDGITRGSGGPQPSGPAGDPTSPEPIDPGTVAPPVDPISADPGDTTAVTPPVTTPPGTDNTPPVADQPPARIVFLIDASGSLVDSLPQMVVWLNQALLTVEPEERFAVYFFKSEEPIAVKPAGMLAPSRDLLTQLAKDWLNPEAVPVFPSGRSNPDQSIAKALSHKPTDLYLLSDDAFALSTGSTTAEQALTRIRQLIGESDVRVHGVQFFYRSDDSVLETLANETDGTFEFVRERVVPDADPIDLLEELGGE